VKNDQTGRWIAYYKPRRQARLRLICLPYAGGGASIYRTWQEGLPENIEVLSIQLPGRENRLAETPFDRMDPLLDALCENLLPWLDRPFAFFGHSLGALVAYEAMLRLRQEASKEAVLFLASAHRAPQVSPSPDPIYQLDDDEFKAELVKLEGTPKEVLEHPELMELVMPLLRGDFTLNDTYKQTSAPRLNCPITALGGLTDHEVGREHLEPWGDLSHGRFKLRMLPGGHFFLQEQKDQLLAVLKEELVPLALPG
jgi:medium-chain acyl-[acyl-carrier-protein] hydrolase